MKNESNNKNELNRERYVDIKATSRFTSLPVKTLYEWASTGKIPSIKIGRRVLFDLHDIDKVMDSFKRSSDQYEKTVNKIIGALQNNGI
jgi:excisionase family DNA binding protein